MHLIAHHEGRDATILISKRPLLDTVDLVQSLCHKLGELLLRKR